MQNFVTTGRPVNTPGFITNGELQVLSLMARKQVSIREVKDAIQHLQTTDMFLVETFLGSKRN